MFCSRCGTRLAEESRFCSQCGQRQDEPIRATATKAPQNQPVAAGKLRRNF